MTDKKQIMDNLMEHGKAVGKLISINKKRGVKTALKERPRHDCRHFLWYQGQRLIHGSIQKGQLPPGTAPA